MDVAARPSSYSTRSRYGLWCFAMSATLSVNMNVDTSLCSVVTVAVRRGVPWRVAEQCSVGVDCMFITSWLGLVMRVIKLSTTHFISVIVLSPLLSPTVTTSYNETLGLSGAVNSIRPWRGGAGRWAFKKPGSGSANK